jgi:hypothetical protein
VADRFVSRFEKAFLLSVDFARNTLDMPEIEKALRTRQPKLLESELGFATAALNRVGGAKVREVLYDALVAAGEAGAEHARRSGQLVTANALHTMAARGELMLAPYVRSDVRFAKDRVERLRTAEKLFDELAFDFVNPKAVEWASERSGTLIQGITKETLRVIRDIVARSYTQGMTVEEMMREIRESVGMLNRDIAAVNNLRDKMRAAKPNDLLWAGKTKIRIPAEGASRELIAKRAAEYAKRLLNDRARNIARTETIAASNEGQRQLWEQAVQKGLLRGKELRKWIVTPDDRLCEQCKQMIGATAPISQPFDVGVMGPPLHPSCRCAVGLIRAPRAKVAA